ncbi:MAG: AI-2E family transporter [Clostridia bacterium]|nr:AI-2E family transporter [Clostridia bacterium]
MKSPFPEGVRARTISNIIVVASGIGIATLVLRFRSLLNAVAGLLDILFPFLLGFVIAFILAPTVNRTERFLRTKVFRKRPHPRTSRFLGILLGYVLLILAIATFIYILVPQLIQSLRSISSYVATYLTTHSEDINKLIEQIALMAGGEGQDLALSLEGLISEAISQILTYSNVLVTNVLYISMSISNFVVQIFIALIAGVYLLIEKEHFAVQGKKILYAFLPENLVKLLVDWLRRCHHIFAGFINGKIVDSLIIGVICYVAMLTLKIDYALLISVVVGVTNLLPFFGPFIGAVPSIVILLMINPWQALKFAIMVLVLQQVDGNIIGPRVLGDSLGISPFWIMVSIIVGSGLFGFAGIVLGAPVFAVIYAVIRTVVDWRLTQKGLPTDTKLYRGDDVVARAARPPESDEDTST